MVSALAALRLGNFGHFCERDRDCHDAAVGRIEKYLEDKLKKNIIKMGSVSKMSVLVSVSIIVHIHVIVPVRCFDLPVYNITHIS